MEAESVKSDKIQIQNVLRGHLDRLNEIPMFKSSMKIFVPENNLANEGSHLWHMINKRPDTKVFWQKQDKIGVCKDKNTADEFQYIINVKMRNKAIRFSDNFFTNSKKHTIKSLKGEFRRQLETFHYEYEEPKTVHGNPRQTITGKMGPSSQDDLMIAFGMGVFWPRLILRDPRRLK